MVCIIVILDQKTLHRADIGKEPVGSGLPAVVPPLLCKFEL